MKSKHDWAQHWASEGFFVFPVEPNSRNPKLKDWPSIATRDPAVIAGWWKAWPDANIGAHPGASGHVVIDVDVKKGKPGLETLAALEVDYGDLPETLTTITMSGGRHIWLALDGSCGNSVGRLGPGLDTRGRRGFVVMPGSAVDGREYQIDNAAPPAPATGAWAEALRRIGDREEKRKAGPVEIDAPEILSRARRYLESLCTQDDVAVEGQGGNDRTFRLAAALHDLGVSEDAARYLAAEIWNPHCRPPWDEDELEVIFRNAYNYAQNEHGAKASGDPTGGGFSDIAPPAPSTVHGPQTKRGRFTPMSIEEAQSLPEPQWLLPGWLPLYATTVLYGKPGSMKSFAALDASLAIASGCCAWGLDYPTQPRPVVYIAGEGQIGLAKLRVPAWLAHHGETPDIPFFMVPAAPRAAELVSDLDAMFAAIEERCAGVLPRLVVYDTHARVMAGLDENSAQDTSRALELYDTTSRRYSCAVLAIHHSGKDGAAERGSTALGAGVDAVLRMNYEEGQCVAILSCEKMKDAEPPKRIAFSHVKVGKSIVLKKTEASKAEPPSASQLYVDIVHILTKHEAYDLGRALTISAVAAEVPAVVECEAEADKESARRRMESTIRRALKGELKVFAAPADGCLMLPQPN